MKRWLRVFAVVVVAAGVGAVYASPSAAEIRPAPFGSKTGDRSEPMPFGKTNDLDEGPRLGEVVPVPHRAKRAV